MLSRNRAGSYICRGVNNNMIKTTVVIPNYNGIKYMEDCLTFLSRCKETEFATIVVDNGSSDGSRELVAEKFPWVELIVNEENLGFCKAVNQGIRASRTPYVLLLNNDTVVDDRFVANLEKAWTRDRVISASVPRCFP